MSEVNELIKTELQEIARVILCEIYGATEFLNGSTGSEISASAPQTAMSADNALGTFERRGVSFNDEGPIQQNPSSLSEQAEFYPRLKRAEFLEQRIQRRGQRQSQNESFDITSAESENYSIKSSDNIAALDLSEKLSDNFCRDARRYDGAFERY